jgi:putative ABC transport system permease protein
MFVPVFIVVVIQIRWAISARSSIYAIGRMLLQLMLIGYVLLFLFDSEHAILVSLVLAVMITVSSWIALRPLASARHGLYPATLAAIAVSGLPTLFLATEWVLDVTPNSGDVHAIRLLWNCCCVLPLLVSTAPNFLRI